MLLFIFLLVRKYLMLEFLRNILVVPINFRSTYICICWLFVHTVTGSLMFRGIPFLSLCFIIDDCNDDDDDDDDDILFLLGAYC